MSKDRNNIGSKKSEYRNDITLKSPKVEVTLTFNEKSEGRKGYSFKISSFPCRVSNILHPAFHAPPPSMTQSPIHRPLSPPAFT